MRTRTDDDREGKLSPHPRLGTCAPAPSVDPFRLDIDVTDPSDRGGTRRRRTGGVAFRNRVFCQHSSWGLDRAEKIDSLPTTALLVLPKLPPNHSPLIPTLRHAMAMVSPTR